jgi:hypothetical protein
MSSTTQSPRTILAAVGAQNRFLGSPYEGSDVNDVEIGLHEMAHAIQFGDTAISSYLLEEVIDELSPLGQELNEIRAAAIELLVARAIGLEIRRGPIEESTRRNLRNRTSSVMRIRKMVSRAMRTVGVQRDAKKLLLALGARFFDPDGMEERPK